MRVSASVRARNEIDLQSTTSSHTHSRRCAANTHSRPDPNSWYSYTIPMSVSVSLMSMRMRFHVVPCVDLRGIIPGWPSECASGVAEYRAGKKEEGKPDFWSLVVVVVEL